MGARQHVSEGHSLPEVRVCAMISACGWMKRNLGSTITRVGNRKAWEMQKISRVKVLGLLLLSILLASCAGYTESGAKTSSQQGSSGGSVIVEISKANGAIEKSIETSGSGGMVLETDLTLAVGKGSYKIELLGQDDQVTLTLEARDGETVSGHGQMVTDSFGEASYRVTAVEAEDVAYALEYTFQ